MQTIFPLHSPDFYAGDPYPAYHELRATTPVCWNDVTNFWALLKYEDIRFVSSNPALFSMSAAFLAAWGFSVSDRSARAEAERGRYLGQFIRSMTGIGATVASRH